MKKALSLILALLLVASMAVFSASVFAEDASPKLVVSEAVVHPGKTASVTLSVENNPGIWGADFVLVYDVSVLTMTGVEYDTAFGMTWTKGYELETRCISGENDGFDDITTNGAIATFTFTVNEDAEFGVIPVTVTYKPGDVINAASEDVDFEIVAGSVTYEAHNFVTETVNPTCTEAGYTRVACSCGEVESETEIPATGHTPTPSAAVAPTCTETGLTEGSFCSVCGVCLVYQETVPALGHNYVDTVTPPTRTEQGYTTHVCDRCGDSYVDSYVEALGIPYGDVNSDGEVNKKDSLRLKQYLAGWSVECDLDAADVNGDGTVNKKDSLRLKQYLAGWPVELGA